MDWDKIKREKYKECKHILDELNNCISIQSENRKFYFSGLLSDNDGIQGVCDRKIRLFVEKKYLDILKKIQYLKYGWYSKFLYEAIFVVEKQEQELYKLVYDNMLTPVDGRKYIPIVEIIDQNKFSYLIDELFSSDLMQLKNRFFNNNHDTIRLEFNSAWIRTPLGNDSLIFWDGIDDVFSYSINRDPSYMLIKNILSLEIPADKISPDWLNLLEKHKNDFDDQIIFNVDIKAQSRKGILQVSEIENKKTVKLLKKV